VAERGEEIVRQNLEVLNRSETVDEMMAGLEGLVHREIEFVNPADAIERGTRHGWSGLRIALGNLIEGAGGGARFEIEELEERGERVLIRARLHARGATSGAQALGPPLCLLYTIEDDRIRKLEWYWDLDEARARFERPG